MRKFITLSISILLVMGLAITAFASASIAVSADKTTANTGDTLTVTVTAVAEQCSQGGVEIAYDKNVLTLTGGACLVSNADIKYFDKDTGDGGFAFENATTLAGPIFQFTFQVKEDAASGTSAVHVNFTTKGDSSARTLYITVACAHQYDTACDTSCNACGATREAKHVWNDGTITTPATCTTTGEKTYTCTACNETKQEVVTQLAHVYDNACDSACNNCSATRNASHNYVKQHDNQNHWLKCTICSHIQNKEKHDLEQTMSTNSQTHGYKCKTCDAIVNAIPHLYINDCDTTCDTCGYVRRITHSYDNRWSASASGHWHECEICRERLETLPHTPGPEATEESNQICIDCGYILQSAQKHEHKMAGDWLNDSTEHWYICACGEQSTPAVHTWGEAIEKDDKLVRACTECGYELAEDIVETPTEPTEPAPTEEMLHTEPPEPSLKPTINIPWKPIALWSIGIAAISILINVLFIRWWLNGGGSRRDYDYEYDEDE